MQTVVVPADTKQTVVVSILIPCRQWLSLSWYPADSGCLPVDTYRQWLSPSWYPTDNGCLPDDTMQTVVVSHMILWRQWLSPIWYYADSGCLPADTMQTVVVSQLISRRQMSSPFWYPADSGCVTSFCPKLLQKCCLSGNVPKHVVTL